MDPQSPNKLIATKYCFLILGENTSFFFFFFISLFFVFCCCFCCYFMLLLIFTKIILSLLFHCIYLFFHVPGCSGMLRHVPECSLFRILSMPSSNSRISSNFLDSEQFLLLSSYSEISQRLLVLKLAFLPYFTMFQ